MSKLYVSEYADIAYVPYSVPLMIASEITPSHDQVVDFTIGVAASVAFQARTKFVRLWADEDCCVKFGRGPTATTSNKPVAAKTPEYFAVAAGDKVSAIGL